MKQIMIFLCGILFGALASTMTVRSLENTTNEVQFVQAKSCYINTIPIFGSNGNLADVLVEELAYDHVGFYTWENIPAGCSDGEGVEFIVDSIFHETGERFYSIFFQQ